MLHSSISLIVMNEYVDIGRVDSKWYNPYETPTDKNLQKFEEHIRTKKELFECIFELRGKKLRCYCRNSTYCHGTILNKILIEQIKIRVNIEINRKRRERERIEALNRCEIERKNRSYTRQIKLYVNSSNFNDNEMEEQYTPLPPIQSDSDIE